MVHSWKSNPLARLAVPFLAGIFVGLDGPFGQGAPVPLVWTAGSAALALLLSLLTLPFRYRWVPGLVFNLSLGIMGYDLAKVHDPSGDPDFLGLHPAGVFLATITEPPSMTGSGQRATTEVTHRLVDGAFRSWRGEALVAFSGPADGTTLQYGDQVLIATRFEAVRDNSNPHSFSYNRYLLHRGTLHRAWAEAYAWKKTGLEPEGRVRRLAFRLRDRLLAILRENKVEGQEFAVAAALLLGHTEGLDPELRKDYANTGATHILSVSGMHVGVIYMFLEFLLGFMNRKRVLRIAKAVLLLVCIWSYAMITGLSPSVLRSAAMLSLPIIGRSMDRPVGMMNVIAASLIGIVAAEPGLLADVGFQLSYFAVGGIVLFYKPIYDLHVTTSWLPDKVWSIIAVSIAAQLATVPLTLYLFHRFPNYFILTNILVVPLSGLIIYAGIIVLATGMVPAVSALLAKGLAGLVWLMNKAIHLMDTLPGSVTDGVYISLTVMLLLYGILIAVYLFLLTLRKAWLWLALALMTVLGAVHLHNILRQRGSARLTVYNSPGQSLVLFSAGNRGTVFYGATRSGSLAGERCLMLPALEDAVAAGVGTTRYYHLSVQRNGLRPAGTFLPLLGYNGIYQFNESRIVILDRAIPRGIAGTIKAEVLVIRGNPPARVEEAVRIFSPSVIVVDATNSRFRARQWQEGAVTWGVKCHVVANDGAFVKEF